MGLVVADTGPINYLILIEHIDLLPALFTTVILPFAGEGELAARSYPSAVRNWATVLDSAVDADLLLMDDRKGVKAARCSARCGYAELDGG